MAYRNSRHGETCFVAYFKTRSLKENETVIHYLNSEVHMIDQLKRKVYLIGIDNNFPSSFSELSYTHGRFYSKIVSVHSYAHSLLECHIFLN